MSNRPSPILIAGVVVALAVLAYGVMSYRAPSACPRESIDAYVASLRASLAKFDDAAKRADETARVALTGVVGDMQAARREIEALTHPECANAVHAEALASTGSAIESFVAFMGEAPGSTVRDHHDASKKARAEMERQVELLQAAAR